MRKNSFRQFRKHMAHKSNLTFLVSTAWLLSLSYAVPIHAQERESAMTSSASKTQLDVDKLVGADPGDIINTNNDYRVTPNSDDARSKTFLLFNVGAQKFFNIGGSYGRHASLSNTGMYLWIFSNSKTSGTYNIRTRQNYVAKTLTSAGNPDNTDSYVQYIDNDALKPGVYLDQQPTDNNRDFGWKFEKADGYDTNKQKLYKISTYGNRYLTATPNDAEGNLCEATNDEAANSNYQIWKLISVKEYYELFYTSPSDLSAPIDATFLLQNPGFNYSTTNTGHWSAFTKIKNPDPSNAVRYGVEECYKKGTETNYKGDKTKDTKYLCEDGKYFCADIKNIHQAGISQQIAVSKPGWYIFRCNGFSNTKGIAKIFISNYMTFAGYTSQGEYGVIAANLLNPLDANGPKDLLEAGKRFYNGEYENQVMMRVTQDDLTKMGGTEYLEFGIMIDGDKNATPTNEWTAFDNFRMLYAGDPESANLVLDEDNPDLKYLTETCDEYKNTVLHLRRSFTLNKWNTFILPVNLTYGQMKRTFGDEVRLAELKTLSGTSVQFWTVDCKDDNDIMLKAFTPYIIKPTKEAGQNPSYTTLPLKKAANQNWLSENEGITYSDEGVTRYTGGKVTVAAGHYDISGITLDRDALTQNLDKHWVSTTSGSTDGNSKQMVCKGTMAKTFYAKGNQGYFYTDDAETRDNLSGDYFMKNGEMWKVPQNSAYGLKGFRCWFSLSDNTDTNVANQPQKSKDVKIFINGIADDTTTGIEDIIDDDPTFHVNTSNKAFQNAVYNLNGQLVRQGTSTEGLPAGLYLVSGKKVMVK